jgi:hypothetical protein
MEKEKKKGKERNGESGSFLLLTFSTSEEKDLQQQPQKEKKIYKVRHSANDLCSPQGEKGEENMSCFFLTMILCFGS